MLTDLLPRLAGGVAGRLLAHRGTTVVVVADHVHGGPVVLVDTVAHVGDVVAEVRGDDLSAGAPRDLDAHLTPPSSWR